MLAVYFQRFFDCHHNRAVNHRNDKACAGFTANNRRWTSGNASGIHHHVCENVQCRFRHRRECVVPLPCQHFLCFSCFSYYAPLYSLTVTCPVCFTLSIVEPGVTNKALSTRRMNSQNDRAQVIRSNSSRSTQSSGTLCRDNTNFGTDDHNDSMNHSLSEEPQNLANGQENDCLLYPWLKAKWLDLQKARDQCDSVSNSLDSAFREESEKLERSVDKLKELIEERKRLLIDHYHKILNEKIEDLRRKTNEIDLAQEEVLKASKQFQPDSTDFDMDESLFPNLSALTKSGLFAKNSSGKAKFGNLKDDSIRSRIERFGCVYDTATLRIQLKDPVYDGKFIVSRQNKKSHVIFSLRDRISEDLVVDLNDVEIRLAPNFANNRPCKTNLRKIDESTFELEYALHQQGLYTLNLKFDDKQLEPIHFKCVSESEYESSFCAIHKPKFSHSNASASHRSGPRSMESLGERPSTTMTNEDDELWMTIGQKGAGLGHFLNPQGVCSTSDNGRIVVADSGNQCVQVFQADGECLLRFGVKGRGSGQMLRPTGVCVLPVQNLIAVADYDNRWLSVYKSDGLYVGRFGTGVDLLGPKGLAVDNDGHVIVADNKSSTIHVYDSVSLKLVRKFSSRGDRSHQLAGPHYIAIDDHNRLFITDFHHHCVKIFDCSGSFHSSFGLLGSGDGQFNGPTGIAIDRRQQVLVADWGNNRIQIFDKTGSFLCCVGNNNLFGPQGLCTSEGRFIVSDSGNHCVKIYNYLI